ncbi:MULTISPECIES: hypothetical protein [Parafrankia]|uniref:hypothetical protein n=1 Tax=Parafrankia TaxID=2994362 RepID=UPI000A9BD7BC|nr:MULTISPECIES: hypothetical protein [Parafrankia]MBE3201651.1 hypothetical protein [Parafrankia sp. CH37]
MALPQRFQDPVGVGEAVVLGLGAFVAGLVGPWPWLAGVAGPVTAALVLITATRRGPQPPPPPPQPHPLGAADAVRLVREWREDLGADHPARSRADEVCELADTVELLILRREHVIAGIEEAAAREAMARDLSLDIAYLTRFLDSFYVSRGIAPTRTVHWDELRERFNRVHGMLHNDPDL